jgi:hypothetical protein
MVRQPPLVSLLAVALPLVAVTAFLLPNAPYLRDAWEQTRGVDSDQPFDGVSAFRGALAGKAAAARDIREGRLTIKLPITPNDWAKIYAGLFKTRFGVTTEFTPGAVDSVAQQAAIGAYDDAMLAELRRRFGQTALDEVRQQAQTIYRQRHALLNSAVP